ncbi:MAG TPA: Ig-like domain-containing protein [Acidimicrobiia bacterium]|nr:Ig-like domain-containing protein [Acidimicrobiia bacterium]
MQIEPRRGRRRARRSSTTSVALGLALGLAASILVTSPSEATVACGAQTSLSQSRFEIDVDANTRVNNTLDCIDWSDSTTPTSYRAGVLAPNDLPTGSGDDSFQGASEGDVDPAVGTGSIPPNKSDLKTFGVFAESATPKVLALFWARVQDPKGTTNMDFELNQKFCDPNATPTNCSANGVTPQRTLGDKLITYDLSKGGTVPTISIREWTASGWSAGTKISEGQNALAIGSVNTGTIPAAQSPFGAADPFTFGEAAISYAALFPQGAGCLSLGSAYLKSRSSDSFSSTLKDFIRPQRVHVSNCSTMTTSATATATLGSAISDTATISDTSANAGGSVTFTVYSDSGCTTQVGTSTKPVSGPGSYTSDPFTPTSIGTYYWIASYSGDADNSPASGACGDPNESSVVTRAASSLTTAQRVLPQDSATVGASAGGTPTGTVTFNLYGPGDPTCAGTPAYSETVNLVSGTASTNNTSFAVAAATAGQYRWSSSYSGDANHDPSSSPCGVETFTISIDDDSTS